MDGRRFTTYVSDLAEMNSLIKKRQTLEGNYKAYYSLVNSGKEQLQTTHGDRYDENRPYSISSYVKGSMFLSQLNYLIGKDKTAETIKDIL
jgi:hypothetical protein